MRLPLAHEWDRWLPWRAREGELGGGERGGEPSRRSPAGARGGPEPRLRARRCVGGGGGGTAREVGEWAAGLGAPGAAAGAGAGCGCVAGTRARATVGGGRGAGTAGGRGDGGAGAEDSAGREALRSPQRMWQRCRAVRRFPRGGGCHLIVGCPGRVRAPGGTSNDDAPPSSKLRRVADNSVSGRLSRECCVRKPWMSYSLF